jgi:type II secretory pathway predicted ATPase ExeA
MGQFSTLVCCFKATFALSPSPEDEIPGITVTVDESRTKRALADDPSFMASLTDLDRGLTDGAEGDFSREADNFPTAASPTPVQRAVRKPAPARSAAPAPPRAMPQPPSVPSPFESLPPSAFVASTPTQEPRARRPLLDLFPPVAFAREPPPGPLLGTSAGPALPPVGATRLEAPLPALAPPAPAAPEPVESLAHETFYGLTEKPFSLSTDPKFLYHSTAHDRTAQALLTSIGLRSGVMVITGQFGIGKTSLCRAVLEQLDRRTLTSFLVDPFLSVDDLLETLLIDFGALSRDDLAAGTHPSTHQLRATLHSFLASLASLQASAVVLIDEAQNLPVPVLEELRALAEISDGQRLLHVVLVGEPELLSLLKRQDLRPLNEQVAVRSVLGPLAADELAGYVTYRLAVVGGSPLVEFSDAALPRIHEVTGGVPRLVNILCDRAMARGFEASASVIDVVLVDAAATDLDLSAPRAETAAALRLALASVAFVLLMLVGAAAALWVFGDDVQRAIVQWERVPPAPASPRLPTPEPLHVPRLP